MIDEKFQNMGYGREVVKLALEYIKTLPCGFVETGEKDGNELIAVLKL